jgi:GTP-binding protein
LELGLKPIVVINKVDRPDSRPDEVLNEVFDLFALLEASEAQLDFPALFASARQGWATADLAKPSPDLTPLFEAIIANVPAPAVSAEAPFAMLATLLEGDPYLGRVLTGRIAAGRVRASQTLKALGHDGEVVETARITKLLSFHGLERIAVEEAEAGDIVAIAGFQRATVADSLVEPEVTVPLQARPIDPPTLAMTFAINDGPLAGRDGAKVQSRVIRERLLREAEGNVAIRVSETAGTDAFEVSGRGELQLGVMIETMRREGFELAISRPRVLYRDGPRGREEPIEEVIVDVDDAYAGTVVESMSERRAEMTDMRPSGGGKTRLKFLAPTRGLIGYHDAFLTETRGTGIMHRVMHGYAPYKGPVQGRRTGVLVSTSGGPAVPYALWKLEERGKLFIDPGEVVYPGMVIGEYAKQGDLEVNPLRAKQLTNIRAAAKDDNVILTPPVRLSLEAALAYIEDDELVEVTPKHVRLRKRHLDPHARKRARRQAAE